jgi:hypothetical protein
VQLGLTAEQSYSIDSKVPPTGKLTRPLRLAISTRVFNALVDEAAELGGQRYSCPRPEQGGRSISVRRWRTQRDRRGNRRHVAPAPFAVTGAVLAALTAASNAGRHVDEVGKIVAGDAIATWAVRAQSRLGSTSQP